MDIRLENIGKAFFTLKRGRIEALKEVSLTIERGEFFVLLGPSGCGKSTLLNIIAGIEKNSTGRVSIGDSLVSDAEARRYLPPGDRDIAMVFQSYALYPHMTAYENISFPLRMARTPKDEIERKVREAAEKLRIENLLDAKPGELSGGQRQRIALGRAIVRQPKVLLLDEPLSNLDALLRIDMRAELKKLQRNLGLTTVYVTHDQTEAMSLGDRLAVLSDGKVMQEGTPEGIYRQPSSVFVAEFMGTPPMNILRGEPAGAVRDALDLPAREAEENPVIGIRPEHIVVSPLRGGDESPCRLTGRLEMIGDLGSDYMLYVDFMGERIIVKSAEEADLREGDEVSLNIDPERVYRFHGDTGKVIEIN